MLVVGAGLIILGISMWLQATWGHKSEVRQPERRYRRGPEIPLSELPNLPVEQE